MALLLAFALFLACMLFCLIRGLSLAWGIGFAIVLFSAAGLLRGHTLREIAGMAWKKIPATMIVLRILFLIGILTGLWRSGGTIPFFICFGIRAITPPLFVLVAFLLSALLSYALGTSFGVASTAGVVLMALARSGGVNTAVAAGAILSGVYFGDRGAPTSSCATLVATLTQTRLYDNVKRMFRTAALPYALCLLFYAVLSLKNPIVAVDETLLGALNEQFDLSLWTVLPAALMIALPLLRVPIRITMLCSGVSALALTLALQRVGLWEALRICVLGYAPADPLVASVLSGGGLASMLSSFLMLPLASILAGILEGTGALAGMQGALSGISGRIGRFPTMVLLSVLAAMTLCNQTVVIILSQQLMDGVYQKGGASRAELAMDIANSGVVIAGVVPWCIACSVPLSMMGVGAEAIPYAALLYTIPLCYLFTKRRYFRAGAGRLEQGAVPGRGCAEGRNER